MSLNKHNLLVAYDISSDKVRRQLVKILCKYGVRIQKSIFEFHLTRRQEDELRHEISVLYFKAKSARQHKKNKVIKILILPVCACCFENNEYFGGNLAGRKKFEIA